MNITIESAIAPNAITAFYTVYTKAFGPLLTKAAARHMLTAEEFAAEMTDDRIDKYVVWDHCGEPIALATLATDLTAIPWISPDYFAGRYPEHLARGAVFYLGYTLVQPGHERSGVYLGLMEQVAIRCARVGAVCAYDICAYNDVHIGPRTAQLAESWGGRVDTLDVQTYYAACYDLPAHTGAAS